VGDRGQSPDELADERLQGRLDLRSRRFFGRRLAFEVRVAAASDHHTSVGKLLPVIEPAAGVMRPLVQTPAQRLGDDHLAACRLHEVLDRTEQSARIPVARDDDRVGLELGERLDALALADLHPRFGGMRGKAPDPASRVERPITRVGHRAGVAISERSRRFVDPLDGEPVVAERCVLRAQLLYLLFVCGQPKTADAAQRVAGEPLHPVERLLAQSPERCRALRA
jgi:hypothetical protein